jgi:hypothetical protein
MKQRRYSDKNYVVNNQKNLEMHLKENLASKFTELSVKPPLISKISFFNRKRRARNKPKPEKSNTRSKRKKRIQPSTLLRNLRWFGSSEGNTWKSRGRLALKI